MTNIMREFNFSAGALRLKKRLVIATICLLLRDCATACRAADDSAGIDDLDRQLYVEMVKLAAFNAHFQLEANKHQPWRVITYPMAREAGTALTFSATLLDLNQQARGLHDPRKISRERLKDAVRCGITGNAISGGASALELAQNTWMMWRAKEHGYSPRDSLQYVVGIVRKTDALLGQRDEIAVRETSGAKREALELENRLVRRIREQLIYEFATWSCHSRDRAWRENTFFAVDAAQNFTRMTAGILALKAFNKPRLARPSALCALVANSVATINPISRNIVGLAIRKHQERVLRRALQFDRPHELAQDVEFDPSSPWLQKVVALTRRTQNIDAALDRENRQIEKYRQVAQQQSISGPLIGLTGVTSSILATEAVFGYSDNPRTATRLGFSGRIVQGVGQGYSLLNTPITLLVGMRRNRRLAMQGELPRQILEKRLQALGDPRSD